MTEAEEQGEEEEEDNDDEDGQEENRVAARDAQRGRAFLGRETGARV